MPSVTAVVDYLDQFAPRELAAEWDNVGMLLGDRGAALERVMTCLTVTPASAAEAIAENAGLIVTHHPILFRPVQRLTTASPEGRMLLDLIRAGVAVYSPHTAFDNARGGINEVRRRSGGHPTHFGMRLEFALRSGATGHYAFRIGAQPHGGYQV